MNEDHLTMPKTAYKKSQITYSIQPNGDWKSKQIKEDNSFLASEFSRNKTKLVERYIFNEGIFSIDQMKNQ